MIKKKRFDIEPQFLCDVCSIAITNPLCPNCITMEIEAWLCFYPDLRKKLLTQIKSYLENRSNIFHNNTTTCIKCGNNSTICPYCFTEYVLKELKKLEVNRIILQEFFEFFNFDFDHKGYSKEAEKLGFL